jgi:hypothetical protein
MSLDEILAAADRLDEPALDQLLLLQINQGLPEHLDRCSQLLREKCQAGTATEAEYEEFSQVNEQIELLAAKRVEALIKLSELRQVPFVQLLDDLGIQAPSDE